MRTSASILVICSIGFCAVNALGQPAVPQPAPVPVAGEVEAARGKVREVFADEYKQAKTSQAKADLAREMVKRSRDPNESLVNRYVLSNEALELYATSGDLTSAFQVVDELAKSFDIVPMTEKIGLLQKAARVASAPAHHRFVALVAMRLAGEAVSKEDFSIAKDCFKQAQASVRSAQDKNLQSRIGEQSRRADEMFVEYQAASKAREILADKPDDPTSSLLFGRYRCFTHRDWETGLPLLKQSSNQALAAVASRDLGTSDAVADHIAVANSWMETAKGLKPRERPIAAERAVHWYEQALPVVTGINKADVEKRLEAAYELAGGRSFSKALTKAPNGLLVANVLDCSKQSHSVSIKPAFDLRKSWLLSLEFNPPNLDGGSHAILLWGDSRGGNDPITIQLNGDGFTAAIDDCQQSRRQGIVTKALPSDVGKWVDVKFVYDAVAEELELHLRHRLVRREPMTIVPNADRNMPIVIGGADGHDPRFYGQVRNVWLGNLQ